MRLSCDSKDRGYDPILTRYSFVLFNGKIIDSVFTADEELRYVWRHKKDSRGNYMFSGSHIITEWLVGDVKILFNMKEMLEDNLLSYFVHCFNSSTT